MRLINNTSERLVTHNCQELASNQNKMLHYHSYKMVNEINYITQNAQRTKTLGATTNQSLILTFSFETEKKISIFKNPKRDPILKTKEKRSNQPEIYAFRAQIQRKEE